MQFLVETTCVHVRTTTFIQSCQAVCSLLIGRPLLQGGYTYEPAVVYYNQTADLSGVYLFPWASFVGKALTSLMPVTHGQ